MLRRGCEATRKRSRAINNLDNESLVWFLPRLCLKLEKIATTRTSNPRHLKLSSIGRLEKMATSVAILAQMDPIQARSDVLGRFKGLLKRPAAVLKRPASAAICNASQWPVVAPRVEDAIRRGEQGISAYIPKLLAVRTDDVQLVDDSWVWMGCPLLINQM